MCSGRLREVSSFGWEVIPRAWVEGEVGCGVCSVVSCSALSLQLRLPVKKGVSGLPAACKSRRLVRNLNRMGSTSPTLA